MLVRGLYKVEGKEQAREAGGARGVEHTSPTALDGFGRVGDAE